MNKSIYIIILLGLLSYACSFEKFPIDKLNPGDYFKTQEELDIYCNSFYDMLPEGEDIFMSDAKLSDYFATSAEPDLFINGNYTLRESELQGWWKWEDLRNINYFLELNVNEDIPENTKNHYNGIARFFRAWFYFDKVRTFGDVPWYDKVLSDSDPDLYKSRDSREFVMSKVLEDLNFACENISETKDNTASTITKWTALALKSRICLFEGTFRKYHTQLNLGGSANIFLKEASDAALQIINSSTYSLNVNGTTPYRDLFTNDTPISSEVILADIYKEQLARFNNANWLWTSSSTGLRPGLTKSFINTFLHIDGTRFTDNPDFDSTPFTEEVRDRDKRLAQIIRTPDYRLLGNLVSPDFGHTKTGYHFIKYTQDDNPNIAMTHNTNSLPIFRYAEVLLNYAEAMAEQGLMTNEVWNMTIGKIRKRAGITNTLRPLEIDPYIQDMYPDVSSSDILEIRRERGIELVGEGFRFDDLRRWKAGELLTRVWDGIYVPSLNTYYDMNSDDQPDVCFANAPVDDPHPGVFYYILSSSFNLSSGNNGKIMIYPNIDKKFEERKYLYPIPESALLINPNLGQNPEW